MCGAIPPLPNTSSFLTTVQSSKPFGWQTNFLICLVGLDVISGAYVSLFPSYHSPVLPRPSQFIIHILSHSAWLMPYKKHSYTDWETKDVQADAHTSWALPQTWQHRNEFIVHLRQSTFSTLFHALRQRLWSSSLDIMNGCVTRLNWQFYAKCLHFMVLN